MIRVVKQWKRLSRQMVGAPSLVIFKVKLEGALNHLILL